MLARSQNAWRPDPVSDDELRTAFAIAKGGPTSMNTQPMRVLFLRSAEAEERLRPALPGSGDGPTAEVHRIDMHYCDVDGTYAAN